MTITMPTVALEKTGRTGYLTDTFEPYIISQLHHQHIYKRAYEYRLLKPSDKTVNSKNYTTEQLISYIEGLGPKFKSYNNVVYDLDNDIVFSYYIYSQSITLTFNSSLERINEVKEDIEKTLGFELFYTDKALYTYWSLIDDDGSYSSFKLPVKKLMNFHKEFYPFINDVDRYIDDFMTSSSNVLILTGDPGLGKSTFIRYLLEKTTASSMVTYDENLMARDKFYVSFMSSEHPILIIEDADLLLQGRLEAQNKIMSKILNVSDGIIDTSQKKIIFTANLKNVSDIDEALTRPGRCYDILKFRPLTQIEAEMAAKKIGVSLEKKQPTYTIAEIYNNKSNSENVVPLQRMGFR